MDRHDKNKGAGSRGAFLGFCLIITSARAFAAGVEIDGATNTILDTAPNGVPIVNIAAPNASGLSLNSYIRFNVDPQGLILNNANQSVVNTQLGGQIFGNTHLVDPASVILNQVTSTHSSLLNGFTEVAGQGADVIIANPNGLSINGAGFINVPRVTLTTGVPGFDAHGALSGIDVRDGEITIFGAGLNTSAQDATSIYTHYLKLNAKLHARDLDVALGKNQVDYPGRKIVSSTKGTVNRVLLDSSALGGMYANKIVLVGTDQGLGIKLPPEVIASSGDIQVSNDGRIVLQQLDATGNIAVASTETIESNDIVYAQGSVDLDAQDTLQVSAGIIGAGKQITIVADQVDNQGSLIAGLEQDGGLNTWGAIDIQAASVTNQGDISSTNTLTAIARDIVNQGLISSSNLLTLNTDHLANEGTIFSGSDLNLLVRDTLDNRAGATLFAVNDLLLAADNGGGRTAQINNDLGLMQSFSGDIDIYADNFANIGLADVRYDLVYYDLGNQREVATLGEAMTINLAYGASKTKHNDEARRRWRREVLRRLVAQAPHLYAENAATINSYYMYARFLAIETRLTDYSTSTPALLDSGRNLNLHIGNFSNEESIVAAGKDIVFDISGSYLNLSQAVTGQVADYDYYTQAYHHGHSWGYDSYSSEASSYYIARPSDVAIGAFTVTQAGGDISGQIGGNADIGGVLLGQYQSKAGVDAASLNPTNIALPTNDFGLFVRSADPDSDYLVETNPRFTEFSNFVGGGYLLDRLDYSSSETLRRLGDAFYESKLIRDSIFAQSGRRFLDDSVASDAAQFQKLMDNALVAQQDLELAPGVRLNADQINRLSEDIVWLEQQEIDGETVLVPRVYLASSRRTDLRGGRLIAGHNAALQIASLANSGLIEAGEKLTLDVEADVRNQGALVAGEDLELHANADIENISGRIEGTDVNLSSATGDIVNRRNSEDYQYSAHDLDYSVTQLVAAGVIRGSNSVSLEAADEIRLQGSVVEGGSVSLEADRVEIDAAAGSEHFFAGNNNNYVQEASLEHVASTIIGNEIVILSTGATTVRGSRLEAAQDLRVEAGAIDIDALNDTSYLALKQTRDGTLSATVNTSKQFRSVNRGSELYAATVVLVTDQGDIDLTGSEIQAGTRLALSSANDIRVIAGEDGSLDETYSHSSGWLSGGSLYSEREDLEGRVTQSAANSRFGADRVELNAAGDIVLVGVDAVAGDEFSASASDIVIENALSEETTYSKHTRIDVGFDDVVENVSNIDDLIEEEDGKLTLTLGNATYEHAESVSTQTSAVASQIVAGSIALSAGGETVGDIRVQGSELAAEDGITLQASGDVALLDAQHTQSSESMTQSGTAEFSITLQNEYDQVARAIKAVKQAERDLRHAQNDYDTYKSELAQQEAAFEALQQQLAEGVGFIEQADVDEFARRLEHLRDDKEFYETNIALAMVTLTTKSTQLVKQTGRAAASSGTAGFNVGLELDIEALEKQVDEYYRQSRATTLSADAITIEAGDTATVRGSQLQAQERIDIAADKIEILAGENTTRSDQREQQVSFSYTWDALGGDEGGGIDPQELGSSIGANGSRSDSDVSQQVNSQLLAENIRLNSSGDMTVAGANIHADELLEIEAENLNLASVQDSSYSKTRSLGLSHSGSGGGVNSAEGVNERVQTLGTRVTGQQVEITVTDHTEIKGAIIAAIDAEGNDNGQLSLTTNTLHAGSLINTGDSTNRSIGINGGEVSSLDYQNDTVSDRTRSLATLGSGTIQINDTEGSNTRFLNTDITETEVAIYDLESHQGLSGELDTRMLTEDGRKQIAEDWLRTEMIADTIEQIVTSERVSIEDFFNQTDKSHRTYEAVNELVRTDPGLAAMLQDPSLEPDQKQLMLDQITAAVMVELGFVAHENLIIASDQVSPGGEHFYGFFSEETGSAYINDAENDSSHDLLTTAGHEAIHAMDLQSGVASSDLDDATRADINRYATNFGENLSDYTDFALGYHGYEGLAISNEHVENRSELVFDNTAQYEPLEKLEGDYYCTNSYSCYGPDTELILKQSQTAPTPIAILNNYELREKVNQDGIVVGYEAYNFETNNIIVMKPEEMPTFVQAVEAIPFIGFSLENMTIAKHTGSNAQASLHDDGYVEGLIDSWDLYLSSPDPYIDAIAAIAGGTGVVKLTRYGNDVKFSTNRIGVNGKVLDKNKTSINPNDYYSRKVENLDVATEKNQSVFYSGSGNRELAESFARENDRVILEMTPGGKWLDNERLFDADSPLTKDQAANIWKKISERYASEASGNVVGFVKGARPDRIFNSVEYPILKTNPNVTNVLTGGD